MAGTLTKVTPKRINTQQLAWGVMLASFAIFCVIAGSVVLGIRYFLFESRVPLQATIDVARGTPTLTLTGTDLRQTAVTESSDMFGNSILTTDLLAQASVSFFDPKHNGILVASVTVESGSSVNLRQGSRPRFDLSEDSYWIDFEDVYGVVHVYVPDSLGRAILIDFDTTLGSTARLSTSGRYTLIAAGGQVEIVNYSGEALLSTPDMQRNQPVTGGQVATFTTADEQFILAPLNNLLGDAGFSASNVLDLNTTIDQVRPQVWRCNNVQAPDEPVGSFSVMRVDDRPALRLFRGEDAESHGETRCWQGIGTGTRGLDVSTYSSVSIRATFKIVSQTLSTCGFAGSECPLMLAMDYIPVNGGEPVKWYHGFYAFVDPNRFFPLACNGCGEHEQINPNAWYTYESHNLFEIFVPELVPDSILNLLFYASGHQYDVYVSEVTLLVDQAEIPLIDPATSP